MTTEHQTREGVVPNDGPVGGAPGPSAEIDRDADAPTGLPNAEDEAQPLGTTEEAPEGEDAPRRGDDHMPGIPTGGDPPAAS